jgi:methylated-DNA-[protein]-cysteine S-methyltransferase
MDELETALRAAADRLPVEAAPPSLEERALRDGLVDVAYATTESPVGRLLLAATPAGVVRVGWTDEGFDAVLEDLAERISPRVLEAPRRLDDARRQLDEYFAGRRTSFALPLDHQLSRGFRARAQAAIEAIPFGQTGTYASIAAAAGSPRAVRAAGTACATNPIPLIVPCHRVVRSDGSMGQYGGGVERKRLLLELEHALPA